MISTLVAAVLTGSMLFVHHTGSESGWEQFNLLVYVAMLLGASMSSIMALKPKSEPSLLAPVTLTWTSLLFMVTIVSSLVSTQAPEHPAKIMEPWSTVMVDTTLMAAVYGSVVGWWLLLRKP